MDDLIKTMKAQLYERVSSPLTSSFILSWCAWNFRLIVVMLSGMEPTAKFKMIDTVLYPDAWWAWGHLAIGPLVTCLVYVFVYPIPESWAFKWAKKRQHELRTFQANLDSDVPLTPEQSRELRLKCKKTVDETQTFVDEHKAQVDALRQEIYELKTNLGQQNKEIEELEQKAGMILLSDDQMSILRALRTSSLQADELQKKVDVGGSFVLDDLVNELLSLGCIRKVETDLRTLGVKAWAITQPGLKALDRIEKEEERDRLLGINKHNERKAESP